MKLNEIDLTNLDFFVHGDVATAFRVMRAEAPVYWHQRKPGQGFWAVTSYDDALKVYHDPATYSSEYGISLQFNDAIVEGADTGQDPPQYGAGMMMITTDPPRHSRVRQIINRRFTPRAISVYQPHIRKIAGEIIDAIVEKGECDFVVDIAAKLPTAVTCEMMGIPREYWQMMFDATNASIGTDDPEYQQGRTARETGEAAQAQVFSYFSQLIEERKKGPGEDLVSALVHGDVEGGKLNEMEILFNCFLLIVAGQETTRNATSGGMLALIENPHEGERLKSEASIVDTAIEEILRYTTPVTHILRVAKQDGELRGNKIRRGDRVVIWNISANRDEAAFVRPDAFELTRTPNDHLAFGHGEHFCLGANLARLELRVIIDEVTRRIPDIELAGPIERLGSNFVAGIKHMPVRFSPKRASAGAAARV
ncbi:MAG: cytochrome P450 [Candidatus Binataceae bacterium]